MKKLWMAVLAVGIGLASASGVRADYCLYAEQSCDGSGTCTSNGRYKCFADSGGACEENKTDGGRQYKRTNNRYSGANAQTDCNNKANSQSSSSGDAYCTASGKSCTKVSLSSASSKCPSGYDVGPYFVSVYGSDDAAKSACNDNQPIFCRPVCSGVANCGDCTRKTKKEGCPGSTTDVSYVQFDDEDKCKSYVPGTNPSATPAPDKDFRDSFKDAENLTSDKLCKVNPLCNSTVFASKRTPGDITSRLVKNVVFPIAGLLLFLYIVWGGFQVVQGATMGNDNIVANGKQRVTAAIIGFLLLFASYWMWSLVELALGLGTTSK